MTVPPWKCLFHKIRKTIRIPIEKHISFALGGVDTRLSFFEKTTPSYKRQALLQVKSHLEKALRVLKESDWSKP